MSEGKPTTEDEAEGKKPRFTLTGNFEIRRLREVARQKRPSQRDPLIHPEWARWVEQERYREAAWERLQADYRKWVELPVGHPDRTQWPEHPEWERWAEHPDWDNLRVQFESQRIDWFNVLSEPVHERDDSGKLVPVEPRTEALYQRYKYKVDIGERLTAVLSNYEYEPTPEGWRLLVERLTRKYPDSHTCLHESEPAQVYPPISTPCEQTESERYRALELRTIDKLRRIAVRLILKYKEGNIQFQPPDDSLPSGKVKLGRFVPQIEANKDATWEAKDIDRLMDEVGGDTTWEKAKKARLILVERNEHVRDYALSIGAGDNDDALRKFGVKKKVISTGSIETAYSTRNKGGRKPYYRMPEYMILGMWEDDVLDDVYSVAEEITIYKSCP